MMKNQKHITAAVSAAVMVGSIALALFASWAPAYAVTDSNYSAENAQLLQEQAKDRQEALAGIQAAKNAAAAAAANAAVNTGAQTAAPAPAPAPSPAPAPARHAAAPSSSNSNQASSVGQVLGVSTQRDHSKEYYDKIEIQLALANAAAAKVEEEAILDQSTENIIELVLVVMLAAALGFVEMRYAQIAGSGLKLKKAKNKKIFHG